MSFHHHEDWLTRLLNGWFGSAGRGGAPETVAWDWVLAVLIGICGMILAVRKSSWVVDYTVFVFVFNRGLRRMVDYYFHGEFTPFNPISLTPLVVASSMLIPVVFSLWRIPLRSRVVLLVLSAAIGYAFLIGFFRVRLAAVYALAESLAPLGLFAFVLVKQPVAATKDRWMRAFGWAAILASGYGWYQYLTIPPWDAMWLVETKMVGYMGLPRPMQMTVFSTMAERGPLAAFLGFAVVPMIVSKKWRPMAGWSWLTGWLGVILVFSAILLTLSRGGLLFAVIGTGTYLLVNQGRGARQIATAVLLVGAAGWWGMERIPNAERVIKRFESLTEIQEDQSYKGRVMVMSGGMDTIARSPLGLGLGAVGLATRVNTGSLSMAKNTVVDGGYFNVVLTYGVPGTLLLFAALVLAWGLLQHRFKRKTMLDDHVLLGRAMMITLIPACFAGDLLTGFSIFWLALGCGVALPLMPGMRGGMRQPVALRRTTTALDSVHNAL
ncbi:MAG: hypothetical protein KGS60_11230 [Verrucomicrobia bacterium]|nr:hypothetical protein [Verrucomicrobiota bacterium]